MTRKGKDTDNNNDKTITATRQDKTRDGKAKLDKTRQGQKGRITLDELRLRCLFIL